MTDERVAVQSPPANSSFELASRNTSLALQRTRLAADRTLMAVIRTSLSLISFGFTIYQFFNKLKDAGTISGAAPARNFGTALVTLGILILTLGIAYHGLFMLGLRRQRQEMKEVGILHAESGFPASLVLITAVLLWLVGIMAILGLILHVGPFG